MKIEDVQENHFYLAFVSVLNWQRGMREEFNEDKVKTVIKCTQIQDFRDHAGYINVHFKTCLGECIFTYGSKFNWENKDGGVELLEEITEEKLKNTSIVFTDNTHYRKEVNKGVYKEYEL